ncbi:hypothetical protein L6164_026258 [Bauhinia variegata]|uniref:Uncharacterized protein n=1 Tax=Bauhinia variegata TaxID=167791 RepID=A0ACB9LPV9_BAUVA|nr:hypothetical protein L6164_026258 [Bauhinia variegata]
MQIVKDRWKVKSGNYDQLLSDYDSAVDPDVPSRENSPAILPISSRSDSFSPPRIGYIEHRVSKLDTLAGIAIKYGVEVADIRKMNNLVTDHQMFALEYLQIPLPGRHPPSPCLSNDSNATKPSSSDNSPTGHLHHELFDSFQSSRIKPNQGRVSMGTSPLQGYYVPKPADGRLPEGFEMALYSKDDSDSSESGSLPKNSPMSDRIHHRKSRSLINELLDEILEKYEVEPVHEAVEVNSIRWNDKLLRRRQKSEADFTRTHGLLMKEENGNGSGFSARTVKGLAQRPKATSRTSLMSDSNGNGLNPVLIGLGVAFLTDGPSGVRKSSSMSCLQEKENNSSSSLWPTSKWNLKPDLQAFSSAVTGRKNKAALD